MLPPQVIEQSVFLFRISWVGFHLLLQKKEKGSDEKLQNLIETVANSLRKKEIISDYVYFWTFCKPKPKKLTREKIL